MCKDCKFYLKNIVEQQFICCLELERKDKCDKCGEELVPMDYYDEFGNITGCVDICVNGCEQDEN